MRQGVAPEPLATQQIAQQPIASNWVAVPNTQTVMASSNAVDSNPSSNTIKHYSDTTHQNYKNEARLNRLQKHNYHYRITDLQLNPWKEVGGRGEAF